MARTKQIPSDEVRLNDSIATGILAEVLPLPLVRAALARHGKETLRSRKLPREFLVYYVVAMALFSNVNLRSVLKALLEGLSYVFPSFCRTAACESAISQGRERLGEEVMRDLAETVCRPVAEWDDLVTGAVGTYGRRGEGCRGGSRPARTAVHAPPGSAEHQLGSIPPEGGRG